jgi:hypothetical protein
MRLATSKLMHGFEVGSGLQREEYQWSIVIDRQKWNFTDEPIYGGAD